MERRERNAWRLAALIISCGLFWPSQVVSPPSTRAAAASPPPGNQAVENPPASPGAFRSATSAASSPITSIVVNKPAGVTTNDVLLAAITVDATPTITAPAGWTLVRSDVNGTIEKQAMYWHAAGASEPASYTFTFGAAVNSAVAGIVAYSGVNTTTPIDAHGGQANTSASTSVTAPSITTTVANTMLVGFFGLDNDATFTAPSGMTERWDASALGVNDEGSEAADVVKATAGSTGTKVATATVSDTSIGQLVALKPSGTIAFRAGSSAATTPTTSLAINKPSGTAADDVLLAVVTARSDPTITAPSGWSRVRSDVNGTSLTQTVFLRTATGSEPASYTFTFSKAVTIAIGGIIAYSGIDPLSPIDAHGGQANAASASVTAPSITTTLADTTVVGFFGTANDATFTAPSGMTERFDVLGSAVSAGSVEAADVVQAAAGATGSKVATASKSAVNIGQLVALRPAGSVNNLGLQPQHSFESWDLGTVDRLLVNSVTRNSVVDRSLASLPFRGGVLSLRLFYNAKDTANLGLGPGWRLNIQRRLYLHADGKVTFTDQTGARHTFTNPVTVGSVTTYTRPATLYATLVKDTSQGVEFTLTYRDQSRDTFDISASAGLLIRSEDRFGNGVTVAYSGSTSNISTITDSAGSRTIDLTWDTASNPARLSSFNDWAWVSGGVVQAGATGAKRQYRFFYDAAGSLAGWSDPLNASGSCPTNASHLTCLGYTNNLLTSISKTQTVETFTSGTLGTSARTITTEIAYTGGDNVSTVTDAEQQAQGTPLRTSFTVESATKIRVDRPTTTTSYGAVAAGDAYARVQSVWRKLDGTTSFERRTIWDATYPIEPASVTENYGALGGAPARTTSYTYVPNSLGLVSRVVEPLTASTNRRTDYTYNGSNDVLTETVSQDGTNPVVTKSCYSADCTTNTGLTLLKRIDNYVSGGAVDDDTNVATEFTYDAYGQLTRETRHNRAPDGSTRDDRQTGYTYDSLGNQTSAIANYADGTVSSSGDDVTPNATTGARTDLTTAYGYDTAGNRISVADPRRAILTATQGTTYATDTYTRTVADGWGTADSGGSWSGTDASFDVASGVGTIVLQSATSKSAYLTAVSAHDQELLVKIRVDQLAASGSTFTWFHLRRQDASNFYEARVTFDDTKDIRLQFRKTVAGAASTIGSTYTTGEVHTTSASYWARFRLSGTSSVNLKGRLWREGTTEPVAWGLDATDASPPAALQGSGHLGVRFQVTGTGADPVTATYDDLALTSIGGAPGVGGDDYLTRSTFDPLNEQLSEQAPTTPGVVLSQRTSTMTYDELGLVRAASDFASLVTATEYDRAGRATRTFEDADPPGSASVTSVTTYDADGRVLTAKDRRQAADANLGSTKTVYDGLGRVDTVTEAFGSSPDVASDTKTTWDGLDRQTSTEFGYGSPSSGKTVTTYDLGGRAIQVDDGFMCLTHTYDYRDRELTLTDGLAGNTCSAGANSRTITTSYDGLGRAFRKEVTAGADTGDRPFEVTFDAAGNQLTNAVKKGGSTTTATFTVNLLDQVQTEARPDGSTAKANYDPAGNVTDRCFWKAGIGVGSCLPAGTTPWTNPPTTVTTTTSDARNGRIGLVDATSNETTTYDPDHNYLPKAIYLPTGTGREHQQLFSYDSRHRLTGITDQLCVISSGHACSSTSSTGSDTYEYDDSDNRTRVVESNGNTSSDRRYCHDARNQLIYRNTAAACSSAANDESWTYDDAGNRLTAISGGVTTNFAYTAEGQLCDVETAPTTASCTGGNVTYDSAGRTKTYAGWNYSYDADGRLVSACKSSTCASGFDKVEMTYDGEGHRTQVKETAAGGSVTTRDFRYQGDAIVEELTNGTVTRDYVVDAAGRTVKVIVPVGQADAGTYLVVWNGHGDAMALQRVNGDGTLTLANSFTYGTWGQPTTATHNGIGDLGFRFLYVGQFDVQWDNAFGLGLTYMHARHYSPVLGRFLQPDPSRADANSYVYAAGEPVARWDPDGRAWYRVVAKLSVIDPVNIVLNSLKLDVTWSTRVSCCIGLKVINSVSWVTTATAYSYGPFRGWYFDGLLHYSKITAGGIGQRSVGIKAFQKFLYAGQFNALGYFENRLWVSITASGTGSAGCTFAWSFAYNPGGLLRIKTPIPCYYASV